jgi:hypothetical protein
VDKPLVFKKQWISNPLVTIVMALGEFLVFLGILLAIASAGA